MFSSNIRMNASSEESSLNNILQWLTEKACEGIRAILTQGIDCDCVVLIVEIGNRLRW